MIRRHKFPIRLVNCAGLRYSAQLEDQNYFIIAYDVQFDDVCCHQALYMSILNMKLKASQSVSMNDNRQAARRDPTTWSRDRGWAAAWRIPVVRAGEPTAVKRHSQRQADLQYQASFRLLSSISPIDTRDVLREMSTSGRRSRGETVIQPKGKPIHYPFWFGGSASCCAAAVTHPLDLGMRERIRSRSAD